MSWDKQSVESKVKSIIAEKMGVDADVLNDDARFQEDLGGDSLMNIEIVMDIEETLGIEISDQEAGDILVVGKAVEFAWAKVQETQIHPAENSPGTA